MPIYGPWAETFDEELEVRREVSALRTELFGRQRRLSPYARWD